MFESTQQKGKNERNNCINPDPFSGSAFHHEYFALHAHVPHDRYRHRALRGRVVDPAELEVI